ncbi:conserved hypothetical protein [delta proteobacterium NaphS2]|nr:conserved hypothetical protein [delta proteobacterium NaphS2]
MLRKTFGCRPKLVKVFFVVLIIGIFIGTLFCAPHYLAYSDRAKKADVVVLFVGPDFEARKKGTHLLINEGIADYLLIPAHRRVSKVIADDNGGIARNEIPSEMDGYFQDGWVNPFEKDYSMVRMKGQKERKDVETKVLKIKHSHPKLFGNRANLEDTHSEVLRAKEMMDAYGLKSAIFVSSPYHMRRIKIIAAKVFGQKNYDLSFVPTPYEKTCGPLWWTDSYCLKWVMGEYVKIPWFLSYEPFLGPSGERTEGSLRTLPCAEMQGAKARG